MDIVGIAELEQKFSIGDRVMVYPEKYNFPMNDPKTVLLIDAWESQDAIDVHHASPMMQTIISLREKYDLHMSVERYISEDTPDSENRFSMNIHSGQKSHV